MRLAFLTHEPFYPPSGGGSAEALYLVDELVLRGHEVHLFCPSVSDPALVMTKFGVHLHEFRKWQMGRYTSLRTPKYLLYPSFLAAQVARVQRTARFDGIISQHAISAVAAGRLRKRLNVPVVMNFLDYLTGFMETWPQYLMPRPALGVLKNFELNMPRRYQVEGVLTVSDVLADYFANAGYARARIRPIYYGFDSTLFPLRAKRAESKREKLIVMHGSLDHHHLKEIGVRGFREAARTLPNVRLRLVGHETAAVKQFLARIRIEVPGAKVECTGFVPYNEVVNHLHEADLGIVPYEESTGTHCAFVAKAVEYLAVGLPVVSTRLNGISRYFGKEPMISFTDFNGMAFGRAIVERLKQLPPNESELARQASERVRAELDWRVIARRAVDFVEEKLVFRTG